VNVIVFGGLTALALAISVGGVAGVLALSVSWRTRESAIRLALGAHPLRILVGVLIDGTTIAAIGIAAGGLVGDVTPGRQLRSGTPASRADSADRIGSSHRHVSSRGVVGAGCPPTPFKRFALNETAGLVASRSGVAWPPSLSLPLILQDTECCTSSLGKTGWPSRIR